MKAEEFIRRVCGGLPDGRLLLCVSGGADSVALLHACVRGGVKAVAVHCDFHLRGAESERDRRFVQWVCHCLRVSLHVLHFDIQTYMKEHSVSEEMACRELRYEAFRRLRRELECERIVVAHNRDDNDETMLLNLMRGTGVRGLGGMDADNGDIARPMLDLTRAQIEAFLTEIKARHITDSSNLSVDYKRNFLRREILPALRSRWPGLGKALAATRRNMQDAVKVLDACRYTDSYDFMPSEVYERAPSREQLLADWLAGTGVSGSQIREMAGGLRPGKRWNIGSKILSMQASGLRLYEDSERQELPRLSVERLELTESLMRAVRANRDEKVLYYSGGELHCRYVREGDRMASMGMRGTKLVSDLLREGGVDAVRRHAFVAVVDDRDRIIWLPGVKRSRHLLIDPAKATSLCRLTIHVAQKELPEL